MMQNQLYNDYVAKREKELVEEIKARKIKEALEQKSRIVTTAQSDKQKEIKDTKLLRVLEDMVV